MDKKKNLVNNFIISYYYYLLDSLLSDDGVLIFSTMNRTAISYLSAIVGAEYIMNLVPIGTHEWESFIRPNELASLLASRNMIVSDLKGLAYNPFLDSWKFIEDHSVNYILSSRKKSSIENENNNNNK